MFHGQVEDDRGFDPESNLRVTMLLHRKQIPPNCGCVWQMAINSYLSDKADCGDCAQGLFSKTKCYPSVTLGNAQATAGSTCHRECVGLSCLNFSFEFR